MTVFIHHGSVILSRRDAIDAENVVGDDLATRGFHTAGDKIDQAERMLFLLQDIPLGIFASKGELFGLVGEPVDAAHVSRPTGRAITHLPQDKRLIVKSRLFRNLPPEQGCGVVGDRRRLLAVDVKRQVHNAAIRSDYIDLAPYVFRDWFNKISRIFQSAFGQFPRLWAHLQQATQRLLPVAHKGRSNIPVLTQVFHQGDLVGPEEQFRDHTAGTHLSHAKLGVGLDRSVLSSELLEFVANRRERVREVEKLDRPLVTILDDDGLVVGHLRIPHEIRGRGAWGNEVRIAIEPLGPAICTVCDHRLEDATIRACSVRECPNAQKDAA